MQCFEKTLARACRNNRACSIFLCGIFYSSLLIVNFGFTFWDRKTFPFGSQDHFCNIYDLPDMVWVVGKLAIDRINNGKRFLSYVNSAFEIFFLQGFDRIKHAGPPFLPKIEEMVFREIVYL